jgi:hypothetical protein
LRVAAAAAMLLLAACGSESLPPENPGAGADTPSIVPITLPERLDYQGRWAVRPDMCETGWWNFTDHEVRTAGEMTCLIFSDDRTANSATLKLSCVGEGMPGQETWRLAGTSESMTVTRSSGAVELLRCPS